jgi:hypothetical protein
MRKSLIMAVMICFALPLLIGCARKEDETIPRTYYESLVLDTPESAVETFVDAFQKDNFEALYLIFAPNTQRQITNSINLLQYQDFVKATDNEEAFEIASDSIQYKPLSEWEHMTSSYRFDSLMLAARQHSAFLIDLSGHVSILRTVEFVDDGGRVFADVITNAEGIDGEAIFRMEQAPSGRWRVSQVILPGGDEDLVPWSVPTKE